jgi:hypothetical protein
MGWTENNITRKRKAFGKSAGVDDDDGGGDDDDDIFNCSWVDTRWQQYSTHLLYSHSCLVGITGSVTDI